MKLTPKQRAALQLLADTPRKSGKFFRDLGVSPITLANMEGLGLAGAIWRQATGETTVLRRSWYITDAGRAALQEGKE
ncbi:hypothetical protein [Aquamicrobium zhengzhouense]|uniref:Uncharacterized protein n=1 Tax=Aquamicrobium zhengzhouense TaxID=2781738 RepID=A0ABS0SAQ0_9HYPH|nr:hypothetical protein [Aquamicrobium zhengzhouense]MBI1620311.1 hypothetical protein [Aquamicrobium zhengzhouense]